MVKDILREWWLKPKKLILLYIVIDIIVVSIFDVFNWTFAMYKFVMMLINIGGNQINALIPISESDKKKRIIIQVLMSAGLCTVLFSAGLSGFFSIFYHNQTVGRTKPVLIILWVLMWFVLEIDMGISTKQGMFSRKGNRYKHQNISIFILGYIIQVMIFWGIAFESKMMLRIVENRIMLLVTGFMIIILTADIVYSIKRFTIGDWIDDELLK